MSEARPQSAPADGRGRRVGIVVGQYNPEITNALLDGARLCLQEAGVAAGDIQTVEVAGAFELPLLADHLLRQGVDGVIALGAVIRGDTPHFDYVCEAAMQGCLRVSLDMQKPVAFGVLTCDTTAQAHVRAQPNEQNKGREAAAALLQSLHAMSAT